jgi:hypothetical protein
MDAQSAPVGRGRKAKLTREAVIAALSEAGPGGLTFNELFGKLDKGSKSTLWNIVKALVLERIAERDIETRKYVLSDLDRRERVMNVPLKLSKHIVDLMDLAVSKKLAVSRSELAEAALVNHLCLLAGDPKFHMSVEQLQRRLGIELGLAGHLSRTLMSVDRRLGQLEKRVRLLK